MVRYVARKNSIETYLDDRLIDIRAEMGLDPTGTIRMVLSPNVALASLRVRPLPPEHPLYRPVGIGGFLNASVLNGRPIDRSTLPTPGQQTRVGDVPFVFPEPDDRGNDHIWIGPSWAQFSGLEGVLFSQGGEFGGRWPTAISSVNPRRIQLRAPNDHYTKLHVIAAAGDEPDSVPVISAQFYKGLSGFPETFASRVPLFTAKASHVEKLPVRLQGGKRGSLYLVTIELDPGKLSKLGRLPPTDSVIGTKPGRVFDGVLPILELELTKEVKLYRESPDPANYSFHAAGLPSSVHVYALTLERAPLRLAFEPDKFAHIWTAPVVPSYTVTLGNRTATARAAELTLSTISHDGSEKTEQKQTVTVEPGDADTTLKLSIGNLKRFGYHDVFLTLKDGAQTWTEKRSLGWLAPDTRERGNWEDGRGPMLGAWFWGGAHETPTVLQHMQVMREAGLEHALHGYNKDVAPEVMAYAQANQFVGFCVFGGNSLHKFAFHYGMKDKWDRANPDASMAVLFDEIRKIEYPPGPLNRRDVIPVFGEPSFGLSTYANMPEYYGEPEYDFSPDLQRDPHDYLAKFLAAAKVLRRDWPSAKIPLPWGDPGFCIPFLRQGEEYRQLIDGVAVDMPQYERMPEMQLHQITIHRLYQTIQEFKKYGKTPFFEMTEGPIIPSQPGALTWDEHADIHVRNLLILFAYGVYRHAGTVAPFDCANYWGESHNGSGLITRLPHTTPKPAYVAYATLSRHLNRAHFEKWLPTGSRSVYALQFKHSKTSKLIHVFWTIRGKRPVTLTTADKITVYDEDDNPTELAAKDGKVTFTLDSSPCYVEGLTADPVLSLGEPDHSDSKPSALATRLGNLGDSSWKLSSEPDLIYQNNMPQIARFPGKMSAKVVEVSGGHALAVQLKEQDKERKTMPWYTSIVPKKPIVIPGKASHLGLWVHAASDWGRVIYSLRDAKGQRWISIGAKDGWNCDDIHQWSSFCFDGWRYLRFELPAHAPYDRFHELGTTWWGHHGPGEGIVHLPLRLEKIIVERRTHVMYVNDPQPAKPDDVLLGDLYAEYASEFDRSDAAVKQSRIAMKPPTGLPELANPIKNLAAVGKEVAKPVTRIEPPGHEYDGTRCLVYFDKSPSAVSYDIWVSPYADGKGAVKLASGWKEPGQLLTGLRPGIEFYAFVVYTDKDGKQSKPSKPFPFVLKDLFPMK
jgi:hypothetical protein